MHFVKHEKSLENNELLQNEGGGEVGPLKLELKIYLDMFAPSIERSAEKVFTSGFHSSHFCKKNQDYNTTAQMSSFLVEIEKMSKILSKGTWSCKGRRTERRESGPCWTRSTVCVFGQRVILNVLIFVM